VPRATTSRRGDGRRANELRPVTIRRGYLKNAEGSALIEMGGTRVLCAATVEERVPPFLRNTGRGWVTAEYSMLPRSSHERITREVTRGHVGGRTHEIQRLIGRSLRAVTKLEALGERQITIDCDVIEADGGTRTASITGSFRRSGRRDPLAAERVELPGDPLQDFVAAVSVGIAKGVPVLDLCYEEDSKAEVDMNLRDDGCRRARGGAGDRRGRPLQRARDGADDGPRKVGNRQADRTPEEGARPS
jgi:ribonuclease PH